MTLIFMANRFNFRIGVEDKQARLADIVPMARSLSTWIIRSVQKKTVCQDHKGNGSTASDTRKPVSYDCRFTSNLPFFSAKIDAFFLVNCIPLLGASWRLD